MAINNIKDTNIIGFYHEYDEYGYFSNWYHADFEYAGKRFSSVEQFMMYHKVMMFGKYSLGQAIMESDNVAEIKKLGRTRFPEFNSKIWDETCYAIVKRGVRAKFEQNKDILDKLLDTENKILAECSANDKKWGIGVAIDDSGRYDPCCWTGKNYLGRILMEVREDLKLASDLGKLGFGDAKKLNFDIWNYLAGTLRLNPKYHDTINAYLNTLQTNHEKKCFLYSATLYEWEIAMNTNMGGGLPVAGFWEMKQDIYDISKI